MFFDQFKRCLIFILIFLFLGGGKGPRFVSADCNCHGGSWGSCPFVPVLKVNEACRCTTVNGVVQSYCGTNCGAPWDVLTVFPPFSFYNAAPISTVNIISTFTTIFDNSYYLLTTMTNASICLQQYPGQPTILTTYEDTFKTMNLNGVSSLEFNYYNPTNLSTMSNNQYVYSLTICYAGLTSVPASVNHFPILKTLNLNNNTIKAFKLNAANQSFLNVLYASSNQISSIDITAPYLNYIDLSHNQLLTLQADAFSFKSVAPTFIGLSYNLLTNLSYGSFVLASQSTTIDVSYNQITTMDSQFSKWLDSAANNTINLSYNPVHCDSTAEWMGTYVICPPVKIMLARTELCPNGQPVYEYLIPYARC